MAKRKQSKRRTRNKETQRGTGIDPRAVQIIQRKFGGRRPDRAKAFRTLLQEARRTLEKSEVELALKLAEQTEQLAQSEEERQACDSLLAEIYFKRALNGVSQTVVDDLEMAVLLAPQETRYQVHLARALERVGRVDEAFDYYEAAAEALQDSTVGYLWCMTALTAGRPLPTVDLTPAEQNTLGIAQQLVSGDPESVQLTGPVLGGSLPLWRALTQMLTEEAAVPMEDLKTASEALAGAEVAGIAQYYVGVTALRAGDLDTAWRVLADAQKSGYATPWLEGNLSYLSRARAIRRAETGDWRGAINAGEPILRQVDDRVLAETVSLAHFHLGYDAALAGDWATATHHWQQAEGYSSNRYLAQNLALAREQQADWEGAAEAWRDMIRRRPRKADHPDYLDDNQVAGLWGHAAECYKRANNPVEAIACLRNGLKYAPDDIEMRRELSEALTANEQFEAAESELNRILEKDPDDIEALVGLGQLYATDHWWRSRPKMTQVLKRALELDPDHQEAREILAIHYIEHGRRYSDWGMYGSAAEQYREGLEHLPDYALLYANLAQAERHLGHKDEARQHLLQAFDLEPDRTRTVTVVLHELLHLGAEDDIDRLLPRVRQMPGLLPQFWVDLGTDLLKCHLGAEWAEGFFDDALALVDQPWVSETRAEVLVNIVMNLSAVRELAGGLERMYRGRIDGEVPQSGAKELIDALEAIFRQQNWDKAERLLGKARHKARKAGEEGLLARIEATEELLFAGPLGMFDFLDQLLG